VNKAPKKKTAKKIKRAAGNKRSDGKIAEQRAS
jgi:hypothetical protein